MLDMQAFDWYLKHEGLNMSTLGKKMGRKPAYIKSVTKFGYMRIQTLMPIAEALGAEVGELIYNDDGEDYMPGVKGFKCTQPGKCFGRDGKTGVCKVLTAPCREGKCPFQKATRGEKKS